MSNISKGLDFQPDVIVETTSVCDQSCPGCYAPNLVSKTPSLELAKTRPELFLQPDIFEKIFGVLLISQRIGHTIVAFRGGEPTKNPYLAKLLSIAAHYDISLYLETHGRWLIESNPSEFINLSELIAMIKSTRSIVKVSYDKMHGMTPSDFRALTTRLEIENIHWCVAITESCQEAFQDSRAICHWVPSEKIIFQKKALTQSELVLPRLGVIGVNGVIKKTVEVKKNFLTSKESVRGISG